MVLIHIEPSTLTALLLTWAVIQVSTAWVIYKYCIKTLQVTRAHQPEGQQNTETPPAVPRDVDVPDVAFQLGDTLWLSQNKTTDVYHTNLECSYIHNRNPKALHWCIRCKGQEQ